MKNFNILSLFICLFASQLVLGQATIIKDLTSGAGSTTPKSIVTYKNKVYFVARNPATGFQQLYSSDLTNNGTGLMASQANLQIIGNLAVTDSVLPNSGQLPRYNLFFTRKRIGIEANVFELQEFDGASSDIVRNLNLGLAKTESSPIMDVELVNTSQDESNKYQTHINPITHHSDSSTYYTNIGFNNNRDSLLWSQPIDVDSSSSGIFPNDGTWFFVRMPRDKKGRSASTPIRGRDDNAQGSVTPAMFLSDTMVGIATGYESDRNYSITGRQEARLMFFSKKGTEKRIKSIIYATGNISADSIPTEPYLIQEGPPLSINVTKPGVFYQDVVYFKAENSGIWKCNFRNLNPQLYFNNATADNLTLINERFFFTATSSTTAPNGAIFEIINDTTFQAITFVAGDVFQKFFTINNFCFALKKNGATYTFFRIDGLRIFNLGTAQNVDVAAGFSLINNNTLVFSANNGATGQELYKLVFPTASNLACTTKPTINDCPSNFGDINVNTTTVGGTTADVVLPAFTFTDDCGSANTLKRPTFPRTLRQLPIGDTVYYYTAMNANGNTTCRFKITVSPNRPASCATDNTKPTIRNCPLNTTFFGYLSAYNTNHCVSLNRLDDVNGQQINLFGRNRSDFEIYDNCNFSPTVQSNVKADSCLKPDFLYNITATANDGRNTSSPCTFTFKYVNLSCSPDTIAPVFDFCPRNVVINTSLSCSKVDTTNGDWDIPDITDFCTKNPTIQLNKQRSDCFPRGRTRVVYTATDLSNNQSSCTFNISVIPTTCTTATPITTTNCPTTSVTVFTKTDSAVATWRIPTFSGGNCGQLVIDSTHKSGSKFPIGTTPVIYLATNSQNRTSACTFNVIVSPCVTKTKNDTLKTCNPADTGRTSRTLTAFTGCDSIVTTITTLKRRDSIPQTLSICKGQTVVVGAQSFTTTGFFTVRLTNNQGCDSIITLNLTVNNPDTARVNALTCNAAQVGTSSRTIQRTGRCDSVVITTTTLKIIPPTSRNETICQGQVITIGTQTFNRTGNFSVTLRNTEGCDSVINLALTVNLKDTIRTSESSCTIAQTTIDSSRSTNQFGCERLVIRTITRAAADTIRLTSLTCNAAQVGTSSRTIQRAGRCDSVVITTTTLKIIPPTSRNETICQGQSITIGTQTFNRTGNFSVTLRSTEGCDSIVNLNLTVNPSDTIRSVTTTCTLGNVGSDTLRFRNRFGCDSLRISTRVFSTTDTVKPILSPCPANFNGIVTDTVRNCAVVTWTPPTATDNCSPTVTISSNFPPGSCFLIGTTDVVYNARDQQGNIATCSFKITIASTCATDTTKPTFVNCPRDTVLRTTQTCAVYSWPALIVQDNCGSVIRIGSSHRSGECFNIGTTTVTLSATDANNNFSVCTFKVKVESNNKIADIDTTFSKIRLEPNPTEGDIALIFNSLSSRILTFEFYDAIGRRIERVTKNSSIGENRIEFDVRSYAAGMYWVKPIVSDKPLPALRFIKL